MGSSSIIYIRKIVRKEKAIPSYDNKRIKKDCKDALESERSTYYLTKQLEMMRYDDSMS